MSTILFDLLYALRGLRKSPSFAIAAVLSLAIGIGATAAVFSIANALLLRPLPYKDPDRLVILWNRSPGLGITRGLVLHRAVLRHQERASRPRAGRDRHRRQLQPDRQGRAGARRHDPRVFQSAADARHASRDLAGSSSPTKTSPGRTPTALLSYGTWARRYGSDPAILGKTITLNGLPYEVVGVMPRSFSLPREVMPTLDGAEQAEVLLPLPLPADAAQNRDHEDYNIIGKLKPGVSVQQAQAEMDTITARLRHDHPEVYPPNGGLTFGIVPLLEQVVGDVRRTLYLLLGAVGFVLLIACANVANLQLSRTVARQKEIAVRSALGATRSRIVRQLLTESVLLALCGGALGVLLAYVSILCIRVLGPQSVPRLSDIGIDTHRPAVHLRRLGRLRDSVRAGARGRASAVDVQNTLQDTSRTSAGVSALWGRGNSLRRLLVIAELALCAMLLIGVGLLIRSFYRAKDVPPGFNPRERADARAHHDRARSTKTSRRCGTSITSCGSGWRACPA